MLPVIQRQTYFAVAVADTAVTFAGQGRIERLTITGHAWLSAEGIAGRPERFSDPALPKLVEAAVTAVRGPADGAPLCAGPRGGRPPVLRPVVRRVAAYPPVVPGSIN